MKRLAYLLPLAAFAAIALFFLAGLRHNMKSPGDELPSMLAGKPAPSVTAPPLDANSEGFGPKDLRGHVTVLNVFASWCAPCRQEAPALAELAARKDIQLFGLVQKDTPQKVRVFLGSLGNPFARIGRDDDGRISIEWGVYGVPETFVIDRRGIVILRVTGALTPEVLQARVLPAIAAAQ